jgi:hypothetical protein
MKNLDELKYFFGIEISYNKKGIFLSLKDIFLDLVMICFLDHRGKVASIYSFNTERLLCKRNIF